MRARLILGFYYSLSQLFIRFSSGPVVSGFGSFSSIPWTMPSSCSASFLFSFDLCYLAYYSLVVYSRKIMSISI
jgi:hypothetical protein